MTKNMNLRLGDELHAELKAAAEADNRSLNSEIVTLLDGALTLRAVQVRRQREESGEEGKR